jgi:hypothetical protein
MKEQTTEARIYTLSRRHGGDGIRRTFSDAQAICAKDESVTYVSQLGILGPQITVSRVDFLTITDEDDIYADC